MKSIHLLLSAVLLSAAAPFIEQRQQFNQLQQQPDPLQRQQLDQLRNEQQLSWLENKQRLNDLERHQRLNQTWQVKSLATGEQVFRTCTSVKSSRFNVDETVCLFEL